jgi:hypothetical protein
MLLITLGWIIALAPDLGNQSTAFAYNKNQLKRKRITTAKSCLTVGLKTKEQWLDTFYPLCIVHPKQNQPVKLKS